MSDRYVSQPQRVLLSHGRCFDADADKVIRRILVLDVLHQHPKLTLAEALSHCGGSAGCDFAIRRTSSREQKPTLNGAAL